MKFALAIIIVVLVVDVKPLVQEAANVVLKKYATLKILEDCYGKQTVNLMLKEVGLAYAKCRGQPSFLPILEQMLSVNPITNVVPKDPEIVKEANPETKPQSEAEPIIVYQQPLKPLTPSYLPWMGFGGYDGYGVRNVMWSNLYPPHPSPYYQREFPSPHGEYFHNGPIVDPAGYRWKRDSKETSPSPSPSSSPLPSSSSLPSSSTSPSFSPTPSSTTAAEESTQQNDDEDSNETEIPDEAPATSKPANAPFSLASYFTNKLISKHQSIIGNMTCVLKEIGFIGEDMQPNFESIRNRINQLSVPNSLKTDLFDGIELCQQFSSCVPVKAYGNAPIVSDLVKPYAFFKCFKGRKIEACMKKDLREKFGGLLTGISANEDKQMKEQSSPRQDRKENIESIFNMVYGFDMDAPSDGFF